MNTSPKILFFSLLLLSGCGEKEMSLADACKELDGFCEVKLTADANCKNERREVIVNAAKLKTLEDKTQLPSMQYSQLISLERLVECTHKESLIEYVTGESKFGKPPANGEQALIEYKKKLDEHNLAVARKSEAKERNYIVSTEYLKTLAKLTKGSENPHLQYWHWSREDDRVALSKLMKSYESGAELDYDIRYYLALDYATYDRKKAIELLLTALEDYPPSKFKPKMTKAYKRGENLYADDNGLLHYDILRNLSALYLKEGKTQLAYIMASILKLNNDLSMSPNDIVMSMSPSLSSDENIKKLDKISETLYEEISKGELTRQSHPFLL